MEVKPALLLLLSLSACTPESPATQVVEPEVVDTSKPPTAPPADEEGPEELSAVRWLTRASLDLRGVRPSLEELAAVQADPTLVEDYIDAYLQDPRLGDRVVSLFSTVYQTQSGVLLTSYSDVSDPAALVRSVGEEPLRMVAYIVENDLPYTEVVTADWTMADEHLAAVWPVTYPAGATGWQQSRYTDDRPAAGILSTNSFWWRYTTTLANANRGRANAISRVLLCSDYLTRPIEFDRDVDLLDEGAIHEALSTNAGCIGCHNTLDPLASYLWGFYYESTAAVDVTYYHPEREYYWDDVTGVAPGFYGAPSYGLEDLGRQLAADPRLPECVSRQVLEQLLQREAGMDDMDTLTALREDLLAADMRLRPLLRSVLLRPEYRAARTEDGGTPRKLPRPELLASQIADLTGFRWVYSGHDMMTTDTYGLRTLAGGIDGGFVTAPAPEINATMALSYERLAQLAAWHVVTHDRAAPEDATLFSEVGFTEPVQSNPEAMARQIQALHLRLLGSEIALDGDEVAANLSLWSDLYAIDGDPAAAWAGVLSVLLRDPDFLLY